MKKKITNYSANLTNFMIVKLGQHTEIRNIQKIFTLQKSYQTIFYQY